MCISAGNADCALSAVSFHVTVILAIHALFGSIPFVWFQNGDPTVQYILKLVGWVNFIVF